MLSIIPVLSKLRYSGTFAFANQAHTTGIHTLHSAEQFGPEQLGYEEAFYRVVDILPSIEN